MIITVTLNAAIDKTLAVPNFRLGRRHRAVEQTAMAGGKGVNVARALRALGQPVIATGVAGRPDRHADRRAAHRGGDPQRLRAHPRGVAHLDGGGGPHDRRADRDQRARPARVGGRSSSCSSTSSSTWRKGAAVCVFSGSLPRGVDAGLYGRLIEEMKRLGVTTVLDSEGEPMRLATRKGPDVVSPNELEAEGLVGHEFSDEEDRRAAVREMVELGAARGDHDAARRLPGAARTTAASARLYRATLEPLEPVSTVGSGDAFLAGFVAARYGGRGARTACASRWPAAPSRPSTSAPAWSSSARSSGCVPEVRVEQLETARS